MTLSKEEFEFLKTYQKMFLKKLWNLNTMKGLRHKEGTKQ